MTDCGRVGILAERSGNRRPYRSSCDSPIICNTSVSVLIATPRSILPSDECSPLALNH